MAITVFASIRTGFHFIWRDIRQAVSVRQQITLKTLRTLKCSRQIAPPSTKLCAESGTLLIYQYFANVEQKRLLY